MPEILVYVVTLPYTRHTVRLLKNIVITRGRNNMLEVFLILTVIYIAYIVYTDVDDDKQVNEPAKADMESTKPAEVTPPKAKVAKSPTAKPRKVKVNVKPDTAKAKPAKLAAKAKVNKTAAPKIELRTVEMKNPKTGEQAKVANNYRMVKRWIKEALVEEGLLEKIYKTNEMDDVAKAKVAKALSIIKAMDKYKV